MNFVGILGPATDVLKTGGVGTCVAIAIQYRGAEDAPQYALAHVPYDSDALVGDKQSAVNQYMDAIFTCLGNPVDMWVRVLVNTVNDMTQLITNKLAAHGSVHEHLVSTYGGGTEAVPRMNVVILRQASADFGKLFCYASNKLEFRDESETAKDALGTGKNIVSVLDVMKRQDKHNFRRHVDLYGKARASVAVGYSQRANPYSLVLKESAEANFSPVLAEANRFSRTKTLPWTKNKARPGLVSDYWSWETRIKSRIMLPVPQSWPDM
ncbi:hypothetical protein ACN469_12910 [Corallococcus terminator]